MTFLRHTVSFALFVAVAGCASEQAQAPAGDQTAYQKGPAASSASSASNTTTSMQPLSASPSGRSVYYDFDKSEIRPDARELIQANALYLRDHPNAKVRIEGNADERGGAEYNLALGQRRAEGVAKAMKLLGVAEGRMEAVSLGKEKPKKTGHDETSWAENRRSDIVY